MKTAKKPHHTVTLFFNFYANEDYKLNPPWPKVAIALSMSASDYNRDAIVICTESVAVWRGTNSYTAMNIEAALRDGGPSQG